MISVDFEKLKELYEIVNIFESNIDNNLKRAEAEASGITADGDKLIRRLDEIKRFLDDEISRYQNLERKLNEKANAITFRGSKALNAVYINNISENIQVRAANANAEAFIPLALSGDAALESKSSKLKLKSENAVDKTLKAADEKVDSTIDMVKNTANELKNFAEEKINELGKIEKFVEGKIDGILGALVKELDALESEISEALNDKNLKALGEDSLNLLKTKIAEVFVYNKEDLKAEAKYENNLEKDWNNFKSNVWNEFKKVHPELVKKLEEIKNEIEAELKTALINFEKKYPLVAQVLKVSYKTVTGVFEGASDLVDQVVEIPSDLKKIVCKFIDDPIGTTKRTLKMAMYINSFLNGYPPATEDEIKFRVGIVQIIRSSIDKNVIHGDAESRARFTVNVAGNIAMFVFSDGGSSIKEVGEASKVVEEVSDVEKADEAINTAEKAEGAMNAVEKADSWWSKLEDPLNTLSSFSEEVFKTVDTLKACINTRIEEVFTIVSETKDLGKLILCKLRNPINEVKEIVISKSEFTEDQIKTCLEGCFTGKTLINTEFGLRRIDSIKEGERVYAEDAKTGQKSLKKVLYVYKKHSKDIIIIAIGKEKIETTAPHLFYTEEGFKPAEMIKAGEKIKNDSGNYEEISDISIRHTEAGEAIYNLNVEDYHTYFAGESSLLVHNDCSVSNEEVKTVTDAIKNGKGNNTSYVKSIADLKNVEKFKEGSLEHILEGQLNARGKAVGFHYEGMPTAKGKIIPGTESAPNEFGVYTAKVEVDGVPKTANGGMSSFFPKNWSAQDIVDGINEAYGSKEFVRGSRNTFRGKTSQGIRIEMYIDSATGKIISAFPIY
ncbi:EndoU domain-containing protein [Clostridium neuense]|uniref:EndoU domain-containing protein n=1 Tax=Clostridium neuense TaxID=1728934 RepID=A0ABW8TJ01_9CLOT